MHMQEPKIMLRLNKTALTVELSLHKETDIRDFKNNYMHSLYMDIYKYKHT